MPTAIFTYSFYTHFLKLVILSFSFHSFCLFQSLAYVSGSSAGPGSSSVPCCTVPYCNLVLVKLLHECSSVHAYSGPALPLSPLFECVCVRGESLTVCLSTHNVCKNLFSYCLHGFSLLYSDMCQMQGCFHAVSFHQYGFRLKLVRSSPILFSTRDIAL